MMSTYEIYFDLLPSDLCAASNFRHLYFLVASTEALLSIVSAGLATALGVSMYTHQSFIRLHMSSHPFLQASVFMFAALTMFCRTLIIVGLTSAILMNDAEIFVACAQEDIDAMAKEQENQQWFYEHRKEEEGNSESSTGSLPSANEQDERKSKRKPRVNWPTVPGPYSCGMEPNTLYSSAAKISIAYRHSRHHHFPHNPTEKAQKCFKRRQRCLHRQRRFLAAFPIVQLLCGALSTAFWFSIDSDATHTSMKELLESQLPSLRMFDGYLALWAVGLLHSPWFLLVATWHYARVDWQMQILAVQHVLNSSRRDDNAGAGADASDEKRKRLRPLPNGREKCPGCQERQSKKVQKTIDGIRNSRLLRKAVAKAEKKAERELAEAAMDGSTPGQSSLSRTSTLDMRREHRVAALSALLGKSQASSAPSVSDCAGRRLYPVRGASEDKHRSQAPLSVPVSPTSLSMILGGGESGETSISDSMSVSMSADEAPSVRIPSSYLVQLPAPAAVFEDANFVQQQQQQQQQQYQQQAVRGEPDCPTSSRSSRAASVLLVPTKSSFKSVATAEANDGRGKRKANAVVKRVSFPAYLPGNERTWDDHQRQNVFPKQQQQQQDRAALQKITLAEKERMTSPMTAISEESSGASSLSSVLQYPAKAFLVPAPQSAPAEQIVMRFS